MRRTLLLAACAAALGACNGTPELVGPTHTVVEHGGLEQEITVRGWSADPSGRGIVIGSRIVNRGSEPATVTVVTCVLEPGDDLLGRAEWVMMAMPGCAPVEPTVTLAPGQASPGVSFAGTVAEPGRYTFRVRGAREPELWGEITVTLR